MRVIAPEKEVMIGGAGQNSMEGFGGGGLESSMTARRGQASAEDSPRGESKHAITCSPGKGGRPGSSQEADSSDFGASFREEVRFLGRYIPMLGSHVAGRSLWGAIQDSHLQTQSSVCLSALIQSN